MIKSTNPITRHCDELFDAFLKDAFEHISESQALKNERVYNLKKAITNDVMIDAGMLPVDEDPDDQEKKPPPDDGTEKPAHTTPVPSPQSPDDCSDNKPPPLTPVSSTQIPTTVTSSFSTTTRPSSFM